ncbi:AAA family ATPase [Vibrio fluvialis]|nr:AAA family ATPase [Vibrio fluvialis]
MQKEQSKSTFKFGRIEMSQGSFGYDIQQSWIVKKIIPKKSFSLLYSPPDSFKSFIAIDISCSVATGIKWGDFKTSRGAVLYIAGEGQFSISKRIKAWEIANNTKPENLWLIGNAIKISDPEWCTELIELIKNFEQDKELKVELVVIDTLARCFTGDENSPSDMEAFITACDTIRYMTDTSILTVHHSGKDASKGPRGHTSLLGAVDCDLKVQRIANTNNKVKITNDKQKDSARAPVLTLTFEEIDIGIECEDGEAITSLVRLKEPEYKKEPKYMLGSTLILDALESQPNHTLTRDELRKIRFPNLNPIPAKERQRLSRELESLIESNHITVSQTGKKATGSDLIFLNKH